jgi:hypothetical protein
MMVFYYPHKFSDSTNARIPFTKIDISPKHFTCFDELEASLKVLFIEPEFDINTLNVSRIDLAADIEGITTSTLLSIMNVKHIRAESFNVFKGTIYAGSDPKVRIYNKVKEIRTRSKYQEITAYEKSVLESRKEWTRFEIQIRRIGKNLKELSDNPLSLSSYFDRLEFIRTDCYETHGIMQFIHRLVNRKFRKQIEELKNTDLIERIKDTYNATTIEWFKDREPF